MKTTTTANWAWWVLGVRYSLKFPPKPGNLLDRTHWDTIAFDESAGQAKRSDKSLVDVMKNYLANKSFSRGMETQTAGTPVDFSYTISDEKALHARYITTDTGWIITLDRSLDIFQPFNRKDAFNLQNTVQEARCCRAFEVTYLRNGK